MAIRSLLGGLDEMSFKRTPEGWVFQAPSLLAPFGHSAHYIVNDAQKAAIAAQLRRMWAWTLVLIGVAAAGTPILFDKLSIPVPGGMIGRSLVSASALIIVTFGVVLWHMRAIRPLLAGAQST